MNGAAAIQLMLFSWTTGVVRRMTVTGGGEDNVVCKSGCLQRCDGDHSVSSQHEVTLSVEGILCLESTVSFE